MMNCALQIWEIAVARQSHPLSFGVDSDSSLRCSIIRGSDYIFRSGEISLLDFPVADSGFRADELARLISDEQVHSFNYPVQAGTNSRDTPIKDAQRFNIKVQKDDVRLLLPLPSISLLPSLIHDS